MRGFNMRNEVGVRLCNWIFPETRMEDRGWKIEDGGLRIEDRGTPSSPRFSILYPRSSILHPLSSILYPPSSILYPLSSLVPQRNHRVHLHRPASWNVARQPRDASEQQRYY